MTSNLHEHLCRSRPERQIVFNHVHKLTVIVICLGLDQQPASLDDAGDRFLPSIIPYGGDPDGIAAYVARWHNLRLDNLDRLDNDRRQHPAALGPATLTGCVALFVALDAFAAVGV